MKSPRLTYYDISPSVTAFSTTRHGGYSRGRYGEMNINRYCGDEQECLDKNTGLLCTALGVDKDRLIMPHQTHDTEVRQIATDFFALPASVKSLILEGVDALVTDLKDVCIGVSTADCIPILVYDSRHHAAAAIHAGWRGTAKRIAQKAIETLCATYGSHPKTLQAVIGPGISLDAFEVGDEVYEEFASAGFNMPSISRRDAKWHIDLPTCNKQQLISSGLLERNIVSTNICTYANHTDYFSARRLGTQSGRIFTGIILK